MNVTEFEYGFKSVNGIIKKVYSLHEIPNIKQKCDVWNVLPVAYVRQYTMLKDKNKSKLFEEDIVKLEAFLQTQGDPHDPEGETFHYTYIGVVKYTPSLGFHLKIHTQYCEIKCEYVIPAKIKNIIQSRCERIGNIFENAELLTKPLNFN